MTSAAPETAEDLRRQALVLDEEAREHKRLQAHHRRSAQDKRRELDELKKRCEALGITLEIQEAKTRRSRP